MKKAIEKILGILAKIIVRKYKPFIIGITCSMGKTSTKEAIALVLKKNFFLRTSSKNYNNELGLPLTIINSYAQGKNLFGWLSVFIKGMLEIVLPLKFPKTLVLEMAADKPGDIKYLTDIAPCQIGVITSIAPVHLEKFKTIENILEEKQIIVSRLPLSGWAILNGDDERLFEIKNKIRAKILTFGFSACGPLRQSLSEASGSAVRLSSSTVLRASSEPQPNSSLPKGSPSKSSGGKEGNNIRALEISLAQEIAEKGELKLKGLRFKLSYSGKIIPVFLPHIIARHQIYSVLAALSVGAAMGLNLLEAIETLKEFKPLPGRMKLLNGIRESLIIDDSYNASPEAVGSALETLTEISNLPGRKKIVVLGDMLELGIDAEELHRKIGKKIAENNFDSLVVVGNLAKKIAEEAIKNGFPEEGVFGFNDSSSAGKFLRDKIIYGDVILIKGSQGMRMEKAVKEIMTEPDKAKELLVRQGKEWE